LISSIQEPAHGYRLSRIPDPLPNDDDNHDNVIAGAAAIGLNNIQGPPPPDALCSRNADFVNAPMFTLCSDSSSVMTQLRRDCLASNKFMFTYECLPHAIHNLCMDLVKLYAGVKLALKEVLHMVKTLKSSHLLLQRYDKLCIEKYRTTYTLILFTKTWWGKVFYAAQRATVVKAACAALPGEILNSDLDIDMCEELKQLLTDPSFWKRVASVNGSTFQDHFVMLDVP
jgi:hypothetical protein